MKLKILAFAVVLGLAIDLSAQPSGMALIPAGSFTMGDTFTNWPPELGINPALPLHTVYVSAFYMDKYDVTYALWQTVYSWAIAHGYIFDNVGSGKAANHPVQTVDWYDCVKWCNARSEMEGRTPAYYTSAAQTTVYRSGQVDVDNSSVKWNTGYRLPTEAEWEKAARGGASGQRFPWGNTISESQANYDSGVNYLGSSSTYDLSNTGYSPAFNDGIWPYTSPVGYFPPNGYGLYDMAGNVWQWCWDWFGAYDSTSQTDPRGPVSGPSRMNRGGNWNSAAISCQMEDRYYYTTTYSNGGGCVGFRSVLPPSGLPVIAAQPLNQTAQVGSNVSFTVIASGTLPLNYQWRFNGQNISNATNATLTLNSVTAANGGSYSVRVWNAYGSVTSSTAYLSVFGSPTVLHGRVTDGSGAPLSGAAISVYVGVSVTMLINADANGYYQIPSLGSGAYSLMAVATGYQGQMRGLTLNANTAEQDFQLKTLPLTPNTQQVNRQPTLTYTFGPMGSALKIFDGTQFVPITDGNKPPKDRMTTVLTHGWVQGTPDPTVTNMPFTLWPSNMAAQIRASGVTSGKGNILAWDWRYAATDPPPTPSDASDRTPDQGVALGKALLKTLGANYSQPIHFVGHSLGTMVNAAAANYLHGDRTATVRQDISPTQWSASQTHMTLLDEAQIAEIAGKQVLFDGLDPTALDAFNAAFGNSPPQNWQSPLPVNFKWADNYVSIVGSTLPGAVNVLLQKGNAIGSPVDAHGYPIQWYTDSIARPTVSLLGFQRSYEYDRLLGVSDAIFPPADIGVGSTYDQSPLNSDQLVLEFYANNTFQPLGILPVSLLQTTINAEQAVGNVTLQIVDGAQNYASSFFNYVSGVAAQGGQALVSGLDSSSSLGLFLTTGDLLPSPFVQNNLPRPLGTPNGNNASSTPPMVWLPIQFPANAVAMAFDFTISGDPVDDALVCGVGTNNLFTLQAKYIPTNQFSASRLIDVSAWTGTTNELFFGFLGGTSTNATLQIQNIRFYNFEPPSLRAQVSGNKLIALWPLSAAGFVLQTSTNLTATNSWMTVTNVPVIVNFQYTVTNQISGAARFYRLKQ